MDEQDETSPKSERTGSLQSTQKQAAAAAAAAAAVSQQQKKNSSAAPAAASALATTDEAVTATDQVDGGGGGGGDYLTKDLDHDQHRHRLTIDPEADVPDGRMDPAGGVVLQTLEKRVKLAIFTPNHFSLGSDHQLLLSRDEFPNLNVGDIIEIYHPEPVIKDTEEEEFHPRALLMVQCIFYRNPTFKCHTS